MKTTTVIVLMLLAGGARSAVGEPRFRLVPCERPTPRSCIEVETRGEGKVVAFYDEHGTIVREIELKLPCNYPVVSKNKRNVVIREPVGECDIMAHYRLHLYDVRGDLVGTSEPIMLYDHSVDLLGDNRTVLVIYPAVELPVLGVTILQAQGGALTEVNTLREDRGVGWYIAMDGTSFGIMANAPSREGKAEAVLLRPDGSEIWRVALDESMARGPLVISPRSRFVIACSGEYDARRHCAYLLSIDGRRLRKLDLPYRGGCEVAFSGGDEEEFVALGVGNEIHLLATEPTAPVISHADNDERAMIWSCALLPDRSVAVAMVAGYVTVDQPTTPTLLAVLDTLGRYQKIRTADSNGLPKLLQFEADTCLEIVSSDTTRWFRIQEGANESNTR